MALKLRQGQIWVHGEEFIRIVQLERLEVAYKTVPDLDTGEGKHHRTSKKEFCRLLKGCRLLESKNPVSPSAVPITPDATAAPAAPVTG